jgi:RNA polymerase sigma-70 factor (ECF subfamily)
MGRDAEDAARSLDQFRSYLGLLARLQVEPEFLGKLDLSGVVQQTLFEAQQDLAQYRGRSDGERRAWLRRILANNLHDEVRKLTSRKRDVTRERSLEASLDQSSSRLELWLVAEQSSPSQRAMRNEQLEKLADALDKLPLDQRAAVELHHLRGWPLADVARHLRRSKPAAAGLLHRGLTKLKELLKA